MAVSEVLKLFDNLITLGRQLLRLIIPPPTTPSSKKDHINDGGGKDDPSHLFSKLSEHFFPF